MSAIPSDGGYLPPPDLQPIPDSEPPEYRLAFDYVLRMPLCARVLTIKAGYVTDGASTGAAQYLGFDCFDPSTFAPALCHDALYSAELLPRADCDNEFRQLLLDNGKHSSGVAWLYYQAVNWFGGFVWRRHTPESIAASRALCSLS